MFQPRFLGACLALLVAWAAPCCGDSKAQATSESGPGNSEQGWFAKELQHYRSYPHLDMAYRLMQGGDKEGAVKEFLLYLELAPGDVQAREALISLLRDMGRGQDAMAQAKELTERTPGSGKAWLVKGYVDQDQDQLDRAAQDFDKAVSISVEGAKDPDTAGQALESLAEVRFRQGRYQEVLDILDKIPPGRKRFAPAVQRAFALQRLGRSQEARDAFGRALNLAGTAQERALARRGRAEVETETGDVDQARELLQLALKDDPNNPETLRSLAMLAAKRGDTSQAVDYATRAASLDNTPASREFLANMLIQAGRAQEGVKILGQLAKEATRTKDQARLNLSRGNGLSTLGQWKEAEQAYRAAQAAGAGGEAALGLSVSLEKQDQPAQALAAMQSAGVENMPPDQLRRLAQLASRTGDFAKAATLQRRAIERLPGTEAAPAWRELGVMLESAGQFDQARQALETAQRLDPSLGLQIMLAQMSLRLRDFTQAKRYALEAWTRDPSTKTALDSAAILEQAGAVDEAVDLCRKALGLAKADGEATGALNERLGNLLAGMGKPKEASEAFIHAYEAAPRSRSEDLLRAARASLEAGMPESSVVLADRFLALPGISSPLAVQALLVSAQAALRMDKLELADDRLRQALARGGLSTEQRITALSARADIASRQGRAQESLALLQQAMQAGLPAWRAHYSMGVALSQAKRWREALEEFESAQKIKPAPQTLLAMARCRVALGQPGLAVNDLLSAASQASSLSPEERWLYFAELGNLAAGENSLDLAAQAYSQALSIRPDSALELRLARTMRLMGHASEAWERIKQLLGAPMSASDKALCLEEAAKLRLERGKTKQAAAFLRQAIDTEPNADRHHLLAKVLFDTGWYKQAAEQYRLSLALKEQGLVYADLGFCLQRLGLDQEAIVAWDKALALDPNLPNLQENAAYALKRLSRNTEAVDRFKAVIDQAAQMPMDIPADVQRRAEMVYRLRKETSKMEERFSLTGYLGYFTARNQPQPGTGGQSGYFSPTSNTMEATFTPPVLGFRDERIFQFIGRLNWQNQSDSLEFDSKSWQGALGVRYKPLKSYNIQVGFERLIKIGESGENNWLARLMGSWANGFDLDPFRDNWNYTTLFGEADRYLDKPSRFLFASEVRQGWSFKFASSWVLTPFVVGDAHVWSPDDSKSSFVEGGAGISLKHYFNQTEYSAPRSYLEVIAQYKAGALYHRSADKSSLNGLTLSAQVRF